MGDNTLQTEFRTCKRITATVDVKVSASFPWVHEAWHIQDREKRMERLAHDLNREVSDFTDFLRDHRSQDMIQLDVERDVRDVCSACGEAWETYLPDDPNDPACGRTSCAHCGAILEIET